MERLQKILTGPSLELYVFFGVFLGGWFIALVMRAVQVVAAKALERMEGIIAPSPVFSLELAAAQLFLGSGSTRRDALESRQAVDG